MSVRVGIVGFGYAARDLHVPLITACGMQVAGIVSRRADAVHAVLPAAQVFPDVESLLALRPLDLIVIATPNDLHEPQAAAALEAGKAVLVDKPLAPSVAAVDRLMRMAERHNSLLSVFHNRRWDSDFLTVRKLLGAGTLGEVHTYEARWNRYRPEVPDRWREQASHAGGVLNDLGPHLIDQALVLFGTPEWIQADVWCQRPAAAVDDSFEVRMGIGNLRIILSANSLSVEPGSRFRIHGQRGSFCKSGLDVQEQQLRSGLSPAEASYGWEPPAQYGLLTVGGSGVSHSVPSERGNWPELYTRLRACVESKAPVPVSAADARKGLQIIEAARESSNTRRRIELR